MYLMRFFSLLTLCRLPALLGGLLTMAVAAQAPVDLRLALVIGNAAYPNNALANPVNDAMAMGAALRGLGFTVLELRDAPREEMAAAVAKMQGALAGKNGIGMLYYAGHGLQLDWRNYMVPIDAKLTKASEVAQQTLDVGSVIDAFKRAGNRMNIVVLDACRDNPFISTSATKGLAPMDAPPGTFLAYATAPGNVAEDGETSGSNGLYTRYLLQELTKPVARIEDVFKRVRLNVRKQSNGRQVPWESTSLEDDFYFNDGKIVRPVQPSTDELARSFAAEREEWAKISASKKAADFYAFLDKYPRGFLAEQAQFKLDQVQVPQIVVPADKNGIQALPGGRPRFHLGEEYVWEITDGFTKARRRVVNKVTFVDDETVEFNGGDTVFDQMGGVKKNRLGTKDPAVVLVPADIALGKSWHGAFDSVRPNGEIGNNYYNSKVVAREEIAALGRTVNAFKVQQNNFGNFSNRVAAYQGTYWIDPSSMRVIRSDVLIRVAGRIVEYDSTVLVEARSAVR